MRYYRVVPKYWIDAAREGWSDDAKLLGLYVLTCEHRTLEGLFRLPQAYAVADLGWSAERFAKGFAELLRRGFIEYDEGSDLCLIVKALKWQGPENPNQVKAALRVIEHLPDSPLQQRFLTLAERFNERLAKGLRERYGKPPASSLKPLTPTTNGNVEQEGKSSDLAQQARELGEYWQERCDHSKAILDDKRLGKVKARLKQGYTVEQIRTAIDGAAIGAFVDDRNVKHDDLALICRDSEKLDLFIRRATAKGDQVLSSDEFLERAMQ